MNEFLPDLAPRKKWCEDKPNIQVGDVVQIVDSSMPRNHWPKGRVIEVMPGVDGRVRSAKIKLAKGNILSRPVAKLAFLTR